MAERGAFGRTVLWVLQSFAGLLAQSASDTFGRDSPQQFGHLFQMRGNCTPTQARFIGFAAASEREAWQIQPPCSPVQNRSHYSRPCSCIGSKGGRVTCLELRRRSNTTVEMRNIPQNFAQPLFSLAKQNARLRKSAYDRLCSESKNHSSLTNIRVLFGL